MTGSTHFCKGAVQLINNHDTGTLNQVDRRDLLEANRRVLAQDRGTFLWWQCSSCSFRLRYHVKASRFSTIASNDELRHHPGEPLEYRSIFLAKSHLSLPQFGDYTSDFAKYGCVFCFAQGKPLERQRTTFATGRDLASHISSIHKSSLPPPLLFAFNFEIDNKMLGERRRWELNLRTS